MNDCQRREQAEADYHQSVLDKQDRDAERAASELVRRVLHEELEGRVIAAMCESIWGDDNIETVAREIVEHGGGELVAGLLGRLGVAVMEQLSEPAPALHDLLGVFDPAHPQHMSLRLALRHGLTPPNPGADSSALAGEKMLQFVEAARWVAAKSKEGRY